jgi:arginine decarboxylase
MPQSPAMLHMNAPKLRVDTWHSLAIFVNKLACGIEEATTAKDIAEKCQSALDLLMPIEYYHAFPGVELCHMIRSLLNKNDYSTAYKLISIIILALRTATCDYKATLRLLRQDKIHEDEIIHQIKSIKRHYFEVLVVQNVSEQYRDATKREIDCFFSENDTFVYELIYVKSYEDALIAVTFNFNIHCCLITDFFDFKSDSELDIFKEIMARSHLLAATTQIDHHKQDSLKLAKAIRTLRCNDIELYYLSSTESEKSALEINNTFDKIFYESENYYELHLTILQGIRNHYETPFFDSLKRYTYEPKSSFHALPLARGKSIFHSKWMQDMQSFYGSNLFMAESSSTSGGLDSLICPNGSLKMAMRKAASYFGAQETFFVTNGTSASNKIILQALLMPGDIVLIDHSCHESHHYGLLLTGAFPIFMNGYAIAGCDIAGPITLVTIKRHLLELQRCQLLDRCKMVVLTNCTFEGLAYNTQQYMEEILALKPDMIFFWDEAWFSYARCEPHYRMRTAMFSAYSLEMRYGSCAYQAEYRSYCQKRDAHANQEEFLLTQHLLPDPDKVHIRIYCSQSTHKTLSCLRQGSMIHVYDKSFESVRESFMHAFVMHSTTSPNYQILATMDLARRQAELEGFELMQNVIEQAMTFRQLVNSHPQISMIFQALGPSELIPESLRHSKVKSGYQPMLDWKTVENAWIYDEFVIDPTRITLKIKANLSGYQMRKILMERFNIQINKVSINTLLLQFNIGTLRSSVSYLLDTLLQLAKEAIAEGVKVLPRPPEVPLFTAFAPEFLGFPNAVAGNLRKSFYAGQNQKLIIHQSFAELKGRLQRGDKIFTAAITIPLPPGYPVCLPGQLLDDMTLTYLQNIDLSAVIGGYHAGKGLCIFR